MKIFETLYTAIKELFHGPLTLAEVKEKLWQLAQSRGMDYDQKSIIDVQKVLDKPSDFASRKALWAEFGQTGLYVGSAEQNEKLVDLVLGAVVERDVPIPPA